jgi:secondary thiamine-phosphate synthase enzyme
MEQSQTRLTVLTRGAGLYEITDKAARFVAESGLASGLLTVFCRHTSASLLLGENADPHVQTDMLNYFDRLVPQNMDFIIHRDEGPDDMPAHIRTALTQSSLGIPISERRLLLGTWQGLFLFEHRARPHRREIVLHLFGVR